MVKRIHTATTTDTGYCCCRYCYALLLLILIPASDLMLLLTPYAKGSKLSFPDIVPHRCCRYSYHIMLLVLIICYCCFYLLILLKVLLTFVYAAGIHFCRRCCYSLLLLMQVLTPAADAAACFGLFLMLPMMPKRILTQLMNTGAHAYWCCIHQHACYLLEHYCC